MSISTVILDILKLATSPYAILLVALTASSLSAQKTDTTTPYWIFSYPSSGVQIKVLNANVIEVVNIGRDGVLGYRLGCVDKKIKSPSVVLKMEYAAAAIPMSKADTIIWTHGTPGRAACENIGARLSVVEVRFEDGGQWLAPQL